MIFIECSDVTVFYTFSMLYSLAYCVNWKIGKKIVPIVRQTVSMSDVSVGVVKSSTMYRHDH